MNKGRCFGLQGSMVKSFLQILTSASILMLSIPNWSAASQKLEEQVRRNILHNNPADCERVLDMDFSKKQIFILCRTVGRDLLQKVVPRNHLPKPIKITAEDRKSIISIKEAFSKKGGKQNKVLLPVKKKQDCGNEFGTQAFSDAGRHQGFEKRITQDLGTGHRHLPQVYGQRHGPGREIFYRPLPSE